MDAIYSFDYSILNYINEHFHNAFFDGFFSIITHLADAGWFWIALAALLLCFKDAQDRLRYGRGATYGCYLRQRDT